MAEFKVFKYSPHKPRSNERLTEEEWEKFKPILISLDQQGLPRRKIVKVAADYHGFRGTYAAMITRFKKWGLTTARSIRSVSPAHDDGGASISTPTSSEENMQEAHRPDSKRIDSTDSLCKQYEEFGTAKVLLNVAPPTEITACESSEVAVDDLDQLIHIAQAVTLEPLEAKVLDELVASGTKEMQRSSMLTENVSILATVDESAATPEDPYLPSVNSFPKRSRPPSSSIRSSLSNASSDIRQFIHLAKRLRHTPGTPSTQHFSLASSCESQNFAMETGLGLELDTVKESPIEPQGVRIKSFSFLLRRRKAKKLSDYSGFSDDQSKIPGNAPGSIFPEDEINRWQDLNLDDFKLINTALQAQTKSSSHRCRLAHVSQLPLVSILEASVLAKKYPAARAVLLSSWHDDLTVYYLLDASVTVTESGRLPLLSDAVAEASRRYERWRRFDMSPVTIEL